MDSSHKARAEVGRRGEGDAGNSAQVRPPCEGRWAQQVSTVPAMASSSRPLELRLPDLALCFQWTAWEDPFTSVSGLGSVKIVLTVRQCSICP